MHMIWSQGNWHWMPWISESFCSYFSYSRDTFDYLQLPHLFPTGIDGSDRNPCIFWRKNRHGCIWKSHQLISLQKGFIQLIKCQVEKNIWKVVPSLLHIMFKIVGPLKTRDGQYDMLGPWRRRRRPMSHTVLFCPPSDRHISDSWTFWSYAFLSRIISEAASPFKGSGRLGYKKSREKHLEDAHK